MKRLVLLLPLALATGARPQISGGGQTSGNGVRWSGGFGGYSLDAAKGTERYILTGTPARPATIVQTTDDGTLTLSATERLDVVLAQSRKGGRRVQVIRSANATGAVTVRREDAKGVAATVNGRDTRYVEAGGRLRTEGPVKLVREDPKAGRTLVASGSALDAALDLAATGNDIVRTADLAGPVSVDVAQVALEAALDPDGSTKPGRFDAKGDRLRLDNSGDSPVVVLSGNVRLSGFQAGEIAPGGGTSTGIKTLTLTLNARGELTGAEATGDPVETSVRAPKDKPKPKTGGGGR